MPQILFAKEGNGQNRFSLHEALVAKNCVSECVGIPISEFVVNRAAGLLLEHDRPQVIED
jgi:hypothetical protein